MKQLKRVFPGLAVKTKQEDNTSPTVSATIVANNQDPNNLGNGLTNATGAVATTSQQDLEAKLLPETTESYEQRQARLDKAGESFYTKEEAARKAAAREKLLASFNPIKPSKEQATKQEVLLVASGTQVEPKVAPNAEIPPPFELVPTTILKSEEERAKELEAERARLATEAEAEKERARLAKEAEAEAERVKKEAEERALAEATERASILEVEEKAKQTIPLYTGDTPKDDENEKRKNEINRLFLEILDNINVTDENLKNEIITELLADFTSCQDYIPVDTNNTPGSIQQNSNPPTRDPLTTKKYIAKLTPKTYYGVGIQTELVQKENQNSFLQINQFYDDSGFESALKSKVPPIETANKDFKITAIYCKLGDEEKFYSIDEIFTNCGQDEKVFNLKLCDIFRNPEKRELKLKFSTIEDSIEDQELTIQKSVFTKEAEENSSYKNIKTVIGQQTVTRDQNQTIPTQAPSNPQNIGRAVDKNSYLVVG